MVLIAALAACSGTPKPKPAELQPNPSTLGVRQAWTAKLPAVDMPLQVAVNGDTVTVAAADGTVAAIDARSGTQLWRASVGSELIAGVGSDGQTAAVVTRDNEVVALAGGKVLWKERLSAETFTAPWWPAAASSCRRRTAAPPPSTAPAAAGCGRSSAPWAIRWCCASRACCCPSATRWWPAWAPAWWA